MVSITTYACLALLGDDESDAEILEKTEAEHEPSVDQLVKLLVPVVELYPHVSPAVPTIDSAVIIRHAPTMKNSNTLVHSLQKL